MKSLCFQQFTLLLKPADALFEFLSYAFDRLANALLRGNEMFRGVNVNLAQRPQRSAAHRMYRGYIFDLVPKHFNAQSVLLVGRPDFDNITTHAELAATQGCVVAFVLDVHEFKQEFIAIA
ncbi:hypothetical protein HRbin36_00514 [bacterium HR36]|nr:hypothetical protein HRbin36_00514 [bacterium HR36]